MRSSTSTRRPGAVEQRARLAVAALFLTNGALFANLVPRFPEIKAGLGLGTGLTVVSWLMCVGFLASPPIVGAIADATSLRTGLLVVPLAVVALAGVLSPRRALAAHPEPAHQPA